MRKEKRQQRIQQKSRHILRQARLTLEIFKYNVNQPHRYAKISFCTCGDSNCVMCGNPRKFFGELTMQEKKQRDFADSFDVEMEIRDANQD